MIHKTKVDLCLKIRTRHARIFKFDWINVAIQGFERARLVLNPLRVNLSRRFPKAMLSTIMIAKSQALVCRELSKQWQQPRLHQHDYFKQRPAFTNWKNCNSKQTFLATKQVQYSDETMSHKWTSKAHWITRFLRGSKSTIIKKNFSLKSPWLQPQKAITTEECT